MFAIIHPYILLLPPPVSSPLHRLIRSDPAMAPPEQMHRLHLAPLLFTLLLASLPHCKPQSDSYFPYSSCAPKPYQCGPLQFDIAYPFSVDGVDRPDYCSVPGYLLSCTDAGKLVTTGGGLFQVTGVDYGNRLLTVVDKG